MRPKVTIIWVNYNSSSFIELVLESLQAIMGLDYPNYELIVVDNGSTDNSLSIIKETLRNIGESKVKLIRLNKNSGFTGGNNVAYTAMDPNSKYVVLLNNDAIPTKNSLRQLVDVMENDERLGAAQGIILNYDEKSIDTAGDFVTELLNTYTFLEGKPPGSLKEPIYTTSADAAYSIFRVEAIKKLSNQSGKIFDDLFACFDDHLLGLRIWNAGYEIKVFPIITAKHRRGSSFSKFKPLQLYLITRNILIVNAISNSRYKILIVLLTLRWLMGWVVARFLGLLKEPEHKELPALLLRAFIDGLKIGRMKKWQATKIDIYKAPILNVKFWDALLKVVTQH
ncbi:MAG: glycosyltransferase family 2 protein [Candidatus Bathyarchaeia archaeon]